jgi:2-polyprenyl-6-methoxyphenol hydroxylase-like FAD-dependent oxidoreductase
MRFVVAGGGVAGLAAALAVARAGHDAVVLERDVVDADGSPGGAFDVERRGIPHYFQPHAFLPRGRRLLSDWASDVLDALLEADPQDLALKLRGPRQPGDEDLVYLWVRRPLIEWALRRAAAAEPAVEIRAGLRVTGLLMGENGAPRAAGVAVHDGDPVRGDVVVDARSLPLPSGLAAGGRRTDRFGSHLLLPLLRARRGCTAPRRAHPEPAR